MSDRVEIRLQDYRDIDEQFDAIASVEMVEAVGRRWWGAYLDTIARNLKPGGRAALQFIYMRPELFDRYARTPISSRPTSFPGGMLINEPEFRVAGGSARPVLAGSQRRLRTAIMRYTLKRWRAQL